MKKVFLAPSAVLGFVVLVGCGHSSAVRDRFAGDYGCRQGVKVRKMAGTTYVASGCGETATYTCATDQPAFGARESVCVRESQPQQYVSSRRASAPAPQRSNVERKFDETRKVQTVVASFKVAPKVSVVLAGAPSATLGEVLVELRLPRHLTHGTCESLEVLVNDVPTAGARFTTAYKDAQHTAQARHDFQTFKPLAQQFSTLAVRACGYEAKLDDNAMQDVKKFFVIYSQLAAEVAPQTPAATETTPDENAKEL